jgi:hypothetical protein
MSEEDRAILNKGKKKRKFRRFCHVREAVSPASDGPRSSVVLVWSQAVAIILEAAVDRF